MASNIISSVKELLQRDKSEEEQFQDDFIYFWDDIQTDEYIQIERKSLGESLRDNIVLAFHFLILIAISPLLLMVALDSVLLATVFGVLLIGLVSISYLIVKNRYIEPHNIIDSNVRMMAANDLTGNEELFYSKEEYETLGKYDDFRSNIVNMLRSFDQNSEKLKKEFELAKSMNLAAYRSIDQINLTIENRVASVGNFQETKGYVGRISEGLDKFTENFDRTLSSIYEVNNILKSIGKQTTMLALNAGIEAAKAGVRGRGFEVVASNLRRLAQHAIDSSQRIGSLASEINDKAKGSIEEITIGMNMLNDLLDNNHTDIKSLNDELYVSIKDLDDLGRQLAKMDELVNFERDELKKLKY